jgi:glutathione S-transferase
MALYENGTRFTLNLVDLSDRAQRESFAAIWPAGKPPVLEDKLRCEIVAEAGIIIEYVDLFYPGETRFLPFNPVKAWEARSRDRFFDVHVQAPVQKILTDRLCPPGRDDPYGVTQARAQLRAAFDMIEREMAGKTWAGGDTFGIADCAAGPALWYASVVMPFGLNHPNVAAYLDRLQQRPSLARVLREAAPYSELLFA